MENKTQKTKKYDESSALDYMKKSWNEGTKLQKASTIATFFLLASVATAAALVLSGGAALPVMIAGIAASSTGFAKIALSSAAAAEQEGIHKTKMQENDKKGKEFQEELKIRQDKKIEYEVNKHILRNNNKVSSQDITVIQKPPSKSINSEVTNQSIAM